MMFFTEKLKHYIQKNHCLTKDIFESDRSNHCDSFELNVETIKMEIKSHLIQNNQHVPFLFVEDTLSDEI